MSTLQRILINTSYLVFFAFQSSQAQDTIKLYNPFSDAKTELNQAIEAASASNKHILVQVGGNWCPWCIKLNDFLASHTVLDSILKADYIVIHINYSKENKNLELMQRLDFPQRFGFPVLVVLDSQGNRLHTQDTGLLESGKSYELDKVKGFLLAWNRSALDPAKYLPPE